MASYHIDINAPTKGEGSALEHAQYIQREGRFTEAKYGAVAARGEANFPDWAREDPNAFWKASDQYERANGSVYREFELALPRELSRAQQVALVQRFAEQELGTTRAYQWAIHTPLASDGLEQPHVHLMFSDRQLDGIERGPEQFFKRYNAKHPERGGCRKATYGADKQEAARVYEQIRERWGRVQNLTLERAGVEARVDHRSLRDQGIFDRPPEVHRGPAVSGIEARGEVSQVGQRQREQRLAREQSRERVVAEVRVVTRQERAAERVAVRERRELAQEATGEDRAAVLKRIEADRREQIERASAAAEQRVERRQSLGGRLGKRLVEQARVLRTRIGQQLGRVREWVLERFPDPVRQLPSRSRELIEAVTQKADRSAASAERGQNLGREKLKGWAAIEEDQRRGREAWRAMRQATEQREAERTHALEQAIAPVVSTARPGRGLELAEIPAWSEALKDKPLEWQGQVLKALEGRLKTDRAARLARVQEKARQRSERRIARERSVAQQEPAAPTGLLAGLRRRAHEESQRAWREHQGPLERLSAQAHAQQQRLLDAASPFALNTRVKAWLQRDVPELLERAQTYERERQRLEREHSLQQARGKELGRDFDLER